MRTRTKIIMATSGDDFDLAVVYKKKDDPLHHRHPTGQTGLQPAYQRQRRPAAPTLITKRALPILYASREQQDATETHTMTLNTRKHANLPWHA